ncbi:MAG: hypothetical protein AAF446_02540 [Pseudomonadota bacterium]
MSQPAVRLLLSVAAQIAVRAATAGPLRLALTGLFLIVLMLVLAMLAQGADRILIVLAGLLLGWLPSRNRMLKISQQMMLGWPATLAVGHVARILLAWLQAAVPVLLLLVLNTLAAWLMGADSVSLMAALFAALVGAVFAGFFLPAKTLQRYPDSRYRRGTPVVQARFNLKPIEHDLHALVAARMRPEELAKALVPLFLIVPNQISVQAFVLMILLGTVVLYGSFLLAALPASIRTAKSWLSSAPMSVKQFKYVYRRALWPRFVLMSLLMFPMLITSLNWLPGLLCMVLLVLLLMIWLEIEFLRNLLKPTAGKLI